MSPAPVVGSVVGSACRGVTLSWGRLVVGLAGVAGCEWQAIMFGGRRPIMFGGQRPIMFDGRRTITSSGQQPIMLDGQWPIMFGSWQPLKFGS